MSETVSDKVVTKVSTVGWVAFGLGVLGLIFAMLPGFSFGAWAVTIPAFIVSIIGLAKKGKKWAPLLGLLISIIAGIVAVVVSLTTAVMGIDAAVQESKDNMTATIDEAQGGIGQVVTTDSGMDVTLNSVECGLPTYDTTYSTETAIGQFCVINYTITNNSKEPIIMFTNDVGGIVGDTDLEAATTLGGFGPETGYSIELNPGLSTTGTSVIDIPAGATLDAVTFTGGFFGNEIAILNK